MDCLDEETILAFCRGDLASDVRARAQSHIEGCDECRALVSAVMRSSIPDVKHDIAMAPTTPVGSGPVPSGPSSSPVHEGQVLAGKFEVERVLGAGGMGVVVAAKHTQLGQRFALKFLLPVACEVPGAVSRFLREGKAAAQITSEHVARVVDTGTLDGGAPYLVMEYLEGRDLAAVLAERKTIPPAEAIEYVLQACEAIVEAHSLGIVHRDLKPSNLFLSQRKDGSPLVKVLDFGISKVEGGSRKDVTSTQTMMGSPRYMSPEQMMSAKDVDARTDVWALGVILFELVSGEPVWVADTVQGLCALIASSPTPKLRTKAPRAPALLEEIVERCLAKTRETRMQSVADLALALEPIAPPSAKTSIERILRVAGKAPVREKHAPSRVIAILGALVAALIAVGIALNVSREPRASDPPRPAVREPVSVTVDPPPSVSASTAAPSATPTPTRTIAAKPPPPATRVASAAPPAASSAPPPPAPSASTPSRALTDRK